MRQAMLLLIVPFAALSSQVTSAGAGSPIPAGWRWMTDQGAVPVAGQQRASDSTFRFEHMAPGWHVTMGPGGVLYPWDGRADGRFVLEGEIIYFSDGADAAEYGVFVGGAGLDGMQASWTAFVMRPDGKAAVLRHENGGTRALQEWVGVQGIAGRDTTGFARHRVSVRAEPDSVRFFVNNVRVGAWPRAALAVDGAYGFRIGRRANLHITNLDLTRRLAPFPAPRP
jgi:hypothetical protein